MSHILVLREDHVAPERSHRSPYATGYVFEEFARRGVAVTATSGFTKTSVNRGPRTLAEAEYRTVEMDDRNADRAVQVLDHVVDTAGSLRSKPDLVLAEVAYQWWDHARIVEHLGPVAAIVHRVPEGPVPDDVRHVIAFSPATAAVLAERGFTGRVDVVPDFVPSSFVTALASLDRAERAVAAEAQEVYGRWAVAVSNGWAEAKHIPQPPTGDQPELLWVGSQRVDAGGFLARAGLDALRKGPQREAKQARMVMLGGVASGRTAETDGLIARTLPASMEEFARYFRAAKVILITHDEGTLGHGVLGAMALASKSAVLAVPGESLDMLERATSVPVLGSDYRSALLRMLPNVLLAARRGAGLRSQVIADEGPAVDALTAVLASAYGIEPNRPTRSLGGELE